MSAVERFVAAALPPIKSREEELALIARAQGGDRRAGDTLWRSYIRFVVKVVRGFAAGRKIPVNRLLEDDVVASVAVGFMEAIRTFKPEKAARCGLATHCVFYVEEALRQNYKSESMVLSVCGRGGDAAKRISQKFGVVTRHLEEFGSGADGLKAAADAINVDAGALSDYLAAHRSRSISFDAPVGDNLLLGDVLSSNEDAIDEQLADMEVLSHQRAQLSYALDQLPDRHRDVFMRRRLVEEPDTLQMLGEKYGISRERVRQIENDAMRRIEGMLYPAVIAEQPAC